MRVEQAKLSELIILAKKNGAWQESDLAWAWDVSGTCVDPGTVIYHARFHEKSNFSEIPTRELAIHVRCRKCEECLKFRSRTWRNRARAEMVLSKRTWFVTFTARPDWQFHAQLIAEIKARRNNKPWVDLNEAERFRYLVTELGSELTLFFKRLRKNSGAKLRYILVFEAHKSGLPHAHALIYEHGTKPVLKRHIKGAWTIGHLHAKLASHGHAGYVCKYLTKSVLARVRASQRLGRIAPNQKLE